MPSRYEGASALINITRPGYGTFKPDLETGEIIVLDPWIDGNPSYSAAYSFTGVDAILISQGHFDHIHDALPALDRSPGVEGRKGSPLPLLR